MALAANHISHKIFPGGIELVPLADGDQGGLGLRQDGLHGVQIVLPGGAALHRLGQGGAGEFPLQLGQQLLVGLGG